MGKNEQIIKDFTGKEYAEGFATNIEQHLLEKGLNEGIIRQLSALKEEPEWLLEFRLEAFTTGRR